MTTLRSLVIAGVGAAAMYYGASEYGDRYKAKEIFQRMRPAIEHNYRVEARGRIPADKAKADLLRKERYKDLRKGLAGLEGKTSEARCRFEVDFGKKVKGNPKALDMSEQYEPYGHCGTKEQMKDKSVAIPFFGGLLVMLYGLGGLLRNLFRKEPGLIGEDGAKRQKEMELERKTALEGIGFTRTEAVAIARESVKLQSYDQAVYGTVSAMSMLGTLQSYGFSQTEVQSLVKAYPAILNKSAEMVSAKLISLEDGGNIAADQVRKDVLRLPAMLG